jgi:hypothetical protein
MWTSALVSTVIGTKLPGPGTIYLEQDLKFLSAVTADDTITATLRCPWPQRSIPFDLFSIVAPGHLTIAPYDQSRRL